MTVNRNFLKKNAEPVNFEYIECAQISSCELIEPNITIEGVINIENIPPPPYDGEIIEKIRSYRII